MLILDDYSKGQKLLKELFIKIQTNCKNYSKDELIEIEKFLNLIQTGNRFVRVDEIEKEERPYEENEKRFHVRY